MELHFIRFRNSLFSRRGGRTLFTTWPAGPSSDINHKFISRDRSSGFVSFRFLLLCLPFSSVIALSRSSFKMQDLRNDNTTI